MTYPICLDCKYHLYGVTEQQPLTKEHYCTHPTATYVNPVTGEKTHPTCEQERLTGMSITRIRCALRGALFVPQPKNNDPN